MREILTITIVLVAVVTDSRIASAVIPHCIEQNLQCVENTPFGRSVEHCINAYRKCTWDAIHASPDAITSAGARVPRGEKQKKKIYGPENRTVPEAATNSATVTTTGGAASGGGLGTSGAAATSSNTLSGSSASAPSAIKSGITKPAAIPPQLAERLRRLQQQQR